MSKTFNLKDKFIFNWVLKNKLAMAIDYSARHANIIHASWGQSYKSTTRIVDGIFEDQFGKEKGNHKEQLNKSEFWSGLTHQLVNKTFATSYLIVVFIDTADNDREITINDEQVFEGNYPSL